MKRLSVFRRMLLSLAVMALISQPVASLEPWRVVIRVEGKVESQQPGQDRWSPIWRSRILTDGDKARTLDKSRATIRLADQSEFVIGADTEVEMVKFSLTPEGRTVVLNMQVGKLRARVAKALGKQSRFEVKTPNGVLAARGTDFFVEQTPEPAKTSLHGLLASTGLVAAPATTGANTFVRVFEGVVEVKTGSGTVRFGAGDFGFINGNGGIFVNPSNMSPNPTSVPSGDGSSSDSTDVGTTGGTDADLASADGTRTTTGGGSGPPTLTGATPPERPGDTPPDGSTLGNTRNATIDTNSGFTPPLQAPSSSTGDGGSTSRTGTVIIIIDQ